jgi:hypothetical protein
MSQLNVTAWFSLQAWGEAECHSWVSQLGSLCKPGEELNITAECHHSLVLSASLGGSVGGADVTAECQSRFSLQASLGGAECQSRMSQPGSLSLQAWGKLNATAWFSVQTGGGECHS